MLKKSFYFDLAIIHCRLVWYDLPSQEDFRYMMRNLPVEVEEEDIEEMFQFADKDKDGKLSYKEFQVCRADQDNWITFDQCCGSGSGSGHLELYPGYLRPDPVHSRS